VPLGRASLSCQKKVVVTEPLPGPKPGSKDTQAAEEEVFKPQRGSRWVDIIVLFIVAIVVLGGIGKAFSDSDMFAAAPPATGSETCPEGGCVKPPDELCAGRPVKAIVGPGGSKLYYTGEHPGYQGIIAIHVERGDRWFCTEDGAKAAGFMAAP
jgi:hypothetical protein